MTDTATVDLSEAATVVVPPPKADVPVLGREHIVAADRPADDVATGARAAQLLDGLIAWHNRVPWARRLQPEQVGQAGVVRFAFEAPPAASGAAAELKPLFAPEKLVPGQSAKQLLAFVRQHGLEASPAPADWPLRELAPAGGGDAAAVHWRYLLSAAYPGAYGKSPLRALVGQPGFGAKVPVSGRRGLSLQRVGSALAVAAGLVLAAVMGLRHATAEPTVAEPAVAASAPASTALPAAAAASHASAVAEAVAPEASAVANAVSVAASAVALPVAEPGSASPTSAPAASAAHAAKATPGVQAAHAGHDEPIAKAEQATPAKAEKAAAEAAPTASHGAEAKPAVAKAGEPLDEAAKPPVEQPLPKARPTIRPIHAPLETYDPTAIASAKANGKPEPVAIGPNFALVTAVSVNEEPLVQLRRRLRQAMGREGEDLKLELQPAPGGQVLALWPIANREDATRLADTLRQAGIRMRVVEF